MTTCGNGRQKRAKRIVDIHERAMIRVWEPNALERYFEPASCCHHVRKLFKIVFCLVAKLSRSIVTNSLWQRRSRFDSGKLFSSKNVCLSLIYFPDIYNDCEFCFARGFSHVCMLILIWKRSFWQKQQKKPRNEFPANWFHQNLISLLSSSQWEFFLNESWKKFGLMARYSMAYQNAHLIRFLLMLSWLLL